MGCLTLHLLLKSSKIKESPNFFANLLIFLFAVSFVSLTLLATVVFDKPIPGINGYVPEFEIAMLSDPIRQHSQVWIDGIVPVHVLVSIENIRKVDKNGVEKPGKPADLFPTDGPATGKGTIKYKMEVTERAKIPSFNDTLKMVPMLYFRQSSFTEFKKSIFKFAVVCINSVQYMTFFILWGVALITGGTYFVYKAKSKKRRTRVKKFVGSPVHVKKEMPPNSLLVP